MKLLHLAAMQRGGCQFDMNDLTIDEWIDLGQVRLAIDQQQNLTR